MEFIRSRFKLAAGLFAALSLFFTAAVSADHLMITRYFSGAWVQPDHESQGLILHIADGEDGAKVAVAHWFTFGDDLESSWYVAIGEVDGHNIYMRMFSASGIGFLESVEEADGLVEEIGILVLSFRNCNQGVAEFDTPESALGAGEFPIRRLTSIYHSRCSGGISDDTPSDKRAESLGVRLHAVRDDVTGGGLALFWHRHDRADFKVKVHEAPDAIYGLLVCGEHEGDMEVIDGEGSLEFRSPGIDSKLLLDFNPKGCLIELHDEAGAAFSSGDEVLKPIDKGPKDFHGRVHIGVELSNTGELPDAKGRAGFEIHGNKAEFMVGIADLPEGSYPLLVGGVERGSIEVVEHDGVLAGKLVFTRPHHDGTGVLDFDPRGEVIEVLQGETVILESLFPDE